LNSKSKLTFTARIEAEVQEELSAHRNYIRFYAALVFSLLVVCGLLNIVVDPYLRFGSERIPGFNAVKPTAIKQVRVAKAYEVTRNDYPTVLLGNSRVDVGLDPECSAFPESWLPVYNFGQPGTGSEAALQYLQHLLVHHCPEHVIIAVDFMNFIKDPRRTKKLTAKPINPRLLSERAPDWRHAHQIFQDALNASLSLSAVADSLRTIVAQDNHFSANMTSQGFNSGEAFRNLIRIEGQSALFDQKNAEYAKRCWRRIAPAPGESTELAAFCQLLELCNREGIDVKVYTHPYHADVLEIFDGTGHWAEFENWKRELVSLCAEHDCQLWDFAVFNEVTTEEPPPYDDRTTVMQWYWESGHYRSTLGDLVIALLLSIDSNASYSVGESINEDNFGRHLASIRKSRSSYRAAMPDRRQYVSKIIDSSSAGTHKQ